MITDRAEYFPDLMEVVNLFDGADDLEIVHVGEREGNIFKNAVTICGKEYLFENSGDFSDSLGEKRLFKRFSKLAVYRALCDYTGEVQPWGALTGIRPTKLAYRHAEDIDGFLTGTMLVSERKTEIVKRIIGAQRGIYETDYDNADLFVGIPFCPTRCSYCSFVSQEIGKTALLNEYVAALEKEIAAAMPLIKKLRSVYIGGGTPVSLPKPLFLRVLGALGKFQGVEYTVEAGRPDCIDKEVLELLKEYGVTRIGVNPQTFNDKTLALIGRKHTAEQVVEKFALAREYGFDINCDLIAGLPKESFGDFKFSLDKALSLRPENLTVHTLALKKGAKLKETTSRLSEGQVSEMVDYAYSTLTAAGYEPYYLYRQKYMAGNLENTGYTLSGKACVYNVDVMEEIASNVACGANAVSKAVRGAAEVKITRYGAPKDIKTYIDKIDEIIEEKNKLFDAVR